MRIQRAHVDVVSAIRCAIVVVIVLVFGYQIGRIEEGLALAIGVLFACVADYADAFARRVRTMAWCTIWCAFATFLAGLISELPLVHILVALVVAFACGYGAALGPRAGLIGVLTLVLFAVFGGSDIGTGVAFLDGIFVAIGGFTYILITIAIWPLHRLGSARLSIARGYRELAQAASHSGIDAVAPSIGAEVITARTTLEHMGVRGATADWTFGLVNDLERARLAVLALHGLRSKDADYVDAVTRSGGAVARLIGDSIVFSRRKDLAAALQSLDSLVDAAPQERLGILARDLAQPLHDAAQRTRKPWPIGRRADLARSPVARQPIVERLRAHWHRNDAIFEHAVRLTFAFGVALIFAVVSGIEHAYWFPMTVAWIAKPDLAGTVTRVLMRVVGTLTGIAAAGIVLFIVAHTPLEAGLLMLGVGFASFIAIAYIWANYPVAVTGITMFVLLFEHLAGATGAFDFLSRVIFTAMAGVWVLLVSLTRPRRSGAAALDVLERLVAEIRAYGRTVRYGGDPIAAHADVLRERTAAVAAVTAAATEPKGLWERSGPDIDPGDAAILLADAIDATCLIVTEELLGEDEDPALWVRIDAELDDLQARIVALRAA